MNSRFFILPLLLAVALFGCTEESTDLLTTSDAAELDLSFLVDEGEDGNVDVPDLGFAPAIRNHVDGHQFGVEDVTQETFTTPDGHTEEGYLVGGCIRMTKEELTAQAELNASGDKQYATNNLVNRINTINVVGYTGRGYNLTSKMQTALRWAVNNYNRINTNKQFNLRFGADTNADIVVYRNVNNNGAGGVAGFPSNGRPYKWVQIYAGMENYDTNTNEHVITHEIGHCMGLRHTDYATRRSCNQSGEGAGRDGANYIPGTPRGYDANSIMLACFGSGEDGEFGFYDRVALEYLY